MKTFQEFKFENLQRDAGPSLALINLADAKITLSNKSFIFTDNEGNSFELPLSPAQSSYLDRIKRYQHMWHNGNPSDGSDSPVIPPLKHNPRTAANYF